MLTESHRSGGAQRDTPSPPPRKKRVSPRRDRARESSRSPPRRERASGRRRRRSPSPSSYDSYDGYDSSYSSSRSRSARGRYSDSDSSSSRSRSPSPRRRRRSYSPPPRRSYRRRRYTRTPPPRPRPLSRRTRSPRAKRMRTADVENNHDRDVFTVFVWQLAKRASARDVYKCFSDAGRVRDVRLVMDRYSSRHKNAGYVEFFDERAVQRAVTMSGTDLCGFPIAVRRIAEPRNPDRNHDTEHTDSQFRTGGQVRNPDQAIDNTPASGTAEATANTTETANATATAPGIGWSTRRPIREIQPSAPMPSSGHSAPFAVTKLVSTEELKRLLNPNNLPIPAISPLDNNTTTNLPPVPLPISTRVPSTGGTAGSGERKRLYVGSLAFHLNEHDLRAVFEPFGTIVSVHLQREPRGRSKGYGFVEFSTAEAAKKALELNGVSVAGRAMKVTLSATEHRGGSISIPDGMIGRGLGVGGVGAGVVDRVPLPFVDVPGEIDEGKDGGGLAMNNAQRVMLMQELSRGETIGAKLEGDLKKLEICSQACRSLVLSNMFDPSTEESGFEKELAEEVRDECMGKYGVVSHLHVESKSHGIVYIRFGNIAEATRAKNDLNGRWFGGKKIAAGFVSDGDYSTRFPRAPS